MGALCGFYCTPWLTVTERINTWRGLMQLLSQHNGLADWHNSVLSQRTEATCEQGESLSVALWVEGNKSGRVRAHDIRLGGRQQARVEKQIACKIGLTNKSMEGKLCYKMGVKQACVVLRLYAGRVYRR